MGVFGERFVKEGYGAAWTMRTADLDGNGTKELLYGGQGVVAIGEDDQPLWTFELPAVEGDYEPEQKKAQEEKGKAGGKMGDEGKKYDEGGSSYADKDTEKHGDAEKEAAQKLRFLGVHVRDVRASEGTLLVLDSAHRIHRLDAETGELVYTVELEGDGNACDFALLDADGDTVPDFFPSGGRSAYSGETGEKLWDADIDFTPSIVRTGNLDGQRGRELLLIGNAEPRSGKESYDICPSEKSALMAMHEGMEDKYEGKNEEQRGAPRPGMENDGASGRDQPSGRETEREGGRDQETGRDQQTGRDEAGQGGVVAVDAKGKTLYTANVPEGDIYTASIYDLDGDQRGDAILGLEDSVVMLDTEGQVVQEYPVNGRIEGVIAEDLDGDDQNELIVHAYDQDESTLYAFGMDGMELWNAPLAARAYAVESIDLDNDGINELVTGLGHALEGGRASMKGPTPTVAWTLTENGPQELWSIETELPARSIAAIDMEEEGGAAPMGGNELLIATGDGKLYRVSADTGETTGTWSAGSMNHAAGAGDLDGDGIAEVITGDVFGNVTAIGQDGEPLFEAMLEGDGPTVITGIEVAPNEEGNPGMFVVSGFAWQGDNAGVLEAFDEQGNSLFAVNTPNGLAEAKFADLDGDGRQEIVVPYFGFRIDQESRRETPREEQGRQGRMGEQARQGDAAREDQAREGEAGEERGYEEPTGEQSCGVMAYDLDGNQLWQMDVVDCDIAQIAVGDSDGDGIDEVAFGDLGREGPYHIALLDGDGTIRWEMTSEIDDAVWLEIIEDGVAFGGRSEQQDGHVTVLEAQDGMERWRLDMGGAPNPNVPEMEDSPFGEFAGSLFGQKLEDINGDGTSDIAFTTAEGEIRVLDGANGTLLWEETLKDVSQQGDGREGGAVDFVGGPLAYVPGNEGAPGLLVVTGYDFENFGSEAFAFDVENGDALGNLALDELVVGVVPTTWGRGENGVSITTTYDTYGLDLEKGRQGEERPRPTPRDEEEQGFDGLSRD